ncbi:hydroxyphenylacetyl-CoA thioesterase PaaI [Micromonospora sp. NPDC049101]|uniref:hydroxyphenylacetyl-CoA thioesterase PaaI n=1 Tax=unclassified Micromonospora TaxID=2617518 RepID=UPI0033DE81DC
MSTRAGTTDTTPGAGGATSAGAPKSTDNPTTLDKRGDNGADVRATAQARARELYATDLTCQTLGIDLEEVGPGYAQVRMRVAPTMVNGHGMAHGGYLFLLADAAFAFACNTYGPVTVAQSAQVTFLRPAEVDDELRAEAVERTRFGRAGIYDVTVRRTDGVVIAEFRGQSQMLAGRPVIGTPPADRAPGAAAPP